MLKKIWEQYLIIIYLLQGAKLNPTAIVDQKPWLSIQLLGVSAYGRNNLAFLPSTTLLSSSFDIETNLSRNNYSGYIDIEADGPGASLVIGKYSGGLNSGVKGYTSIKRAPGELANIIAGAENTTFEDGTYTANFSRIKSNDMGSNWNFL